MCSVPSPRLDERDPSREVSVKLVRYSYTAPNKGVREDLREGVEDVECRAL